MIDNGFVLMEEKFQYAKYAVKDLSGTMCVFIYIFFYYVIITDKIRVIPMRKTEAAIYSFKF